MKRLIEDLDKDEFVLSDTIWVRKGRVFDVLEDKEPDYLTVAHTPTPRQASQNAQTRIRCHTDGFH